MDQQWQTDVFSRIFQTKRRVFVSYHHGLDQQWYNRFNQLFINVYDILYDRSLQRKIDSEHTDYVDRRIREDNISAASVVIVLCGAETFKRKYVDWEINSCLHYQKALLGIILPTATKNCQGQIIVPDRLSSNIDSGYAHWIHWTDDPAALKLAVEVSISRAGTKSLIDNRLVKFSKNRP